jgi:hypothetical protein
MKRYLIPVLALLSWSLAAAPSPATVQIKETSVYDKPSVISKFLGKIPYGTQLTVLSTQPGWVQVKSDTLGVCWLRDQAVTMKKLDLQAGSEAGGASSTEVSLAGRGFSEEIEKGYKSKNPQLDYTDVDKMEAMGIEDSVLATFLQDGGITGSKK